MKKITILLLLTTLSFFGQTKIDNIVSITFPEKTKEINTSENGIKQSIYYYKNENDSFVFSRTIPINDKGSEINTLCKNKETLENTYKLSKHILVSDLSKKGFILSETLETNINQFITKTLIFRDSISNKKTAEIILLELNGIEYNVIYAKVREFNENRKNVFFNSLKVGEPEKLRQLIVTNNDNKLITSLLILLTIITVLTIIIIQVRKRKGIKEIEESELKTPTTIEGINESIYAGFWIRFGSILLDTLITTPVVLLLLYLNGLNINVYYYTFLPSLLFYSWYNIYLVKKYGGTPGKLISGITIIKVNGQDITWTESILRQIVTFVLTIFASIITFIAISKAHVGHYESLSWLAKQKYLMTLTPIFFTLYNWTANTWTYSELFILLFNKRKRALHDFIAGTVIIKTKHLEKLREIIG